MRRFTVRSFESAGPLVLGMTRYEVRRALKSDFRPVRKVQTDTTLSDQFLDPLSVAFYDTDDRLEAVEVSDDVVLDWNGILLIGRSAKAIYDDVKPHSGRAEIDDDGVIFHDLGFGFYAPGWRQDATEMNQSVIVFKKRYYEACSAGSKK
jgi:hypothetical protein